MKKTDLSLLICAIFTAFLVCGCKFNLSDSQYLDRPDVIVREGYFEIIAPYISSKTKSITIYRQNVHDSTESEVERVAIIYPKGIEDANDQTMHYDDYCVLGAQEYRYYIRFTDDQGVRNRTEWSDKKALSYGGADARSKIAYTVSTHYTYNPDTMILTSSADFTLPAQNATVLPDIASYKPCVVLQAGEKVQVFEIPEGNTKYVPLKTMVPDDFLDVDVTLLGIVGQKTETNSKDATITKCISWTCLTPVQVKNAAGNVFNPFQLNPEHGADGIDYSTTSDNEND